MREHEQWMRRCIELAKQAIKAGNPPVGALLVKEGRIAGEGMEAGKSKNDITCHAEIEAIRDAISKGLPADMQDCILYTTHEPCIMCSYVIRHHKIGAVVIGVEVPSIGGTSSIYPLLATRQITIWTDPPVILKGILAEECKLLTETFQNTIKKYKDG